MPLCIAILHWPYWPSYPDRKAIEPDALSAILPEAPAFNESLPSGPSRPRVLLFVCFSLPDGAVLTFTLRGALEPPRLPAPLPWAPVATPVPCQLVPRQLSLFPSKTFFLFGGSLLHK